MWKPQVHELRSTCRKREVTVHRQRGSKLPHQHQQRHSPAARAMARIKADDWACHAGSNDTPQGLGGWHPAPANPEWCSGSGQPCGGDDHHRRVRMARGRGDQMTPGEPKVGLGSASWQKRRSMLLRCERSPDQTRRRRWRMPRQVDHRDADDLGQAVLLARGSCR